MESCDRPRTFKLPDVIECDKIPHNRDEIPSPMVAASYAHLRNIADNMPTVDEHVSNELLIVRDQLDTHVVLDQRAGYPLGQRLSFGWVLIGNSCLCTVYRQQSSLLTAILPNGRPTYVEHSDNYLYVKDDPVFEQTVYDECEGLSIGDQTFLNIMDFGFQMSAIGKWTAPLPFRTCRPLLHNSREAAMKRAISFKSYT